MPLSSGKSAAAFSHNVEVEVAAGKPQKQAVAIAYAKKRGDARDAYTPGKPYEVGGRMFAGFMEAVQAAKSANTTVTEIRENGERIERWKPAPTRKGSQTRHELVNAKGKVIPWSQQNDARDESPAAAYERNARNPSVERAYESGRKAPKGKANPFEESQRIFREAWQRGYASAHDGKKPSADEIEAAIAAGEAELEHQKKALAALRGDCSVEMDEADEEVEQDCSAMDSARRLAFDRRMETVDGHLVVTGCHITKANVCPYLGAEIPDSEALGLQPDRIYMLYRDAAEIEAAKDTYNRVPLLMQHVAVSADRPQQFLTVGTVSNARFTHPYLDADLTVWTREGIEAIESGKQRELSCGYRYKADMTPGTSPEGEKYDGRMTAIHANHIALVEAGRAGPDVMVADAMLQVAPRLT